MLRRQMKGHHLKVTANLHHLLDLTASKLGDGRAAILNPDYQAEMLKLQQSLTYRNLADMKLLCNMRFAQRCSRRKLARADRLPQLLKHSAGFAERPDWLQ